MMTVMDWLCRFYIGLESPVSPRCSPSGTMGFAGQTDRVISGSDRGLCCTDRCNDRMILFTCVVQIRLVAGTQGYK